MHLANFADTELGSDEKIHELSELIYPLALDWFDRLRDFDSIKKVLGGIDSHRFYIAKEVWPLIGIIQK